ncbi:AMP-binding protein, partial [Ornithinicoccus halotolerans]|uniref:AMP-binding protein n=1 Tax=Ornithinicoccus halotolerans TaxID=1748220 RepID=UPI00129780CE
SGPGLALKAETIGLAVATELPLVVLADTGLGLRRLGAALRGAGPDHVVAVPRGLWLARVTGVPGRRHPLDGQGIRELLADGAGTALPPEPTDDDADGAVLFTSGATGPPKGVVYRRRTLGHQLAQVRHAFDLGPEDRLVAAFAPFALYGPALGIPSAVPAMDVTAPHTLTAAALADAVAAVDASVVFASPAALRNVLATAERLTADQRAALRGPRLLLSAGAPVPPALLRQLRELLPSARTESPYGMTEVLPVASLDPTTGPDAGDGVCVGAPLPGVTVRVAPLHPDGRSSEELVSLPGVTGELVVRAAHTKDRYDRLWATQQASARPPGWHRTGDVGHLDGQGRLWVEGRLSHVVATADGPVTPYPVEARVSALPDVADVALVGVGPRGTQQPVAVVVPQARVGRRATGLAGAELAARVRTAAQLPLAAVLVSDWLPVDVRHASKVDRAALAGWAARLLHGPRSEEAARARAGGRAPSRRSR